MGPSLQAELAAKHEAANELFERCRTLAEQYGLTADRQQDDANAIIIRQACKPVAAWFGSAGYGSPCGNLTADARAGCIAA